MPLPDIHTIPPPRFKSGIPPIDTLMGGGFVPGSSVLLAGAPGAGKSTLVMQILNRSREKALYSSGEESLDQLKLRADRLRINSPEISLLFEMNVDRISSHVQSDPVRMLVVDSVQTAYSGGTDSIPGTPTQIRKCAYLLRRVCQQTNTTLLLVGQVTKARTAAGPNLLQHAVDVVLSLDAESADSDYRTLHASKNRFGSTSHSCSLRMTQLGFYFSPVIP